MRECLNLLHKFHLFTVLVTEKNMRKWISEKIMIKLKPEDNVELEWSPTCLHTFLSERERGVRKAYNYVDARVSLNIARS